MPAQTPGNSEALCVADSLLCSPFLEHVIERGLAVTWLSAMWTVAAVQPQNERLACTLHSGRSLPCLLGSALRGTMTGCRAQQQTEALKVCLGKKDMWAHGGNHKSLKNYQGRRSRCGWGPPHGSYGQADSSSARGKGF